LLERVLPQPYTPVAFEGYQHAKEQDTGREYTHRARAVTTMTKGGKAMPKQVIVYSQPG
jgi:hypothetical protein